MRMATMARFVIGWASGPMRKPGGQRKRITELDMMLTCEFTRVLLERGNNQPPPRPRKRRVPAQREVLRGVLIVPVHRLDKPRMQRAA